MQDSHTPASYIIAVIAVIGGAWLMPPFPIFFLIIGPLCLLGLILYGYIRAKRTTRTTHARNIEREKPMQVDHTPVTEECGVVESKEKMVV